MNLKKFTPLYYATLYNHLDVVQWFWLSGLKLEDSTIDRKVQSGITILHLACEKGFLPIIEFLSQNGVDLNAKNADNETPMHMAARNGHANVIKFLLEKGVNPSEISLYDVL